MEWDYLIELFPALAASSTAGDTSACDCVDRLGDGVRDGVDNIAEAPVFFCRNTRNRFHGGGISWTGPQTLGG